MERTDDSYHNSDDQPKDLTSKTAKKLKPIPPPLNLNANENGGYLPSSLLKASFATSPKSPLMQKHLPFRKRAHQSPVEENIRILDKGFPSKDLNSPVDNNNALKIEAVKEMSSSSCNYVLDLSTNQNSSVLLSPASSSLGNSREELTDSNRVSQIYQTRLWGLPWPPPIWHCFQPGTRLKLGSLWCIVDEMGPCPADWPQELKVEHMTIRENTVLMEFSSMKMSDIMAEVTRAHAFLVKDRGWTAVCGETLFCKYSVRCPSLQLQDVIMLPTIHKLALPLPLPSPDICERIKRFSFPHPDEPQSPNSLVLSPPSTPTRKNHDSDKPKRPMNAFMLFAKRFRLELIQSHPGKDNRAISVILGEVWRTLPQEEREIYIRGARDLSEEQKLLHPDCWKRKRSHSTS